MSSHVADNLVIRLAHINLVSPPAFNRWFRKGVASAQFLEMLNNRCDVAALSHLGGLSTGSLQLPIATLNGAQIAVGNAAVPMQNDLSHNL